jgi:hypothetical protein
VTEQRKSLREKEVVVFFEDGQKSPKTAQSVLNTRAITRCANTPKGFNPLHC